MTLLINNSMWLPKENIKLAGQEERSGYVLASDVRWTSVLYAEGSVAVLRTEDVDERESCTPSRSANLGSLSQIQSRKLNDLPVCVSDISENNEPTNEEDRSLTTGAWWILAIAAALAFAAVFFAMFALTKAGSVEKRQTDAWRLDSLKTDIASMLVASKTRFKLVHHMTSLYSVEEKHLIDRLHEEIAKYAESIGITERAGLKRHADNILKYHTYSSDALNRLNSSYITTPKNTVQTEPSAVASSLEALARMDQTTMDAQHDALVLMAQARLGLTISDDDIPESLKPADKTKGPSEKKT